MRILNLPESSNIQAAYYTKSDKSLVVEFKSGMQYLYLNVPEVVCDTWEKEESAGKAFHNLIKKGEFAFHKISDEKKEAV